MSEQPANYTAAPARPADPNAHDYRISRRSVWANALRLIGFIMGVILVGYGFEIGSRGGLPFLIAGVWSFLTMALTAWFVDAVADIRWYLKTIAERQ